MRVIIAFLTLLCATVSAWDVTLYKHRGCGRDAPSGTAEYMRLSSANDMGYCAGVGWIGKNPNGNLQRDIKCRYYWNGGRNNADCNDQMRGFESYFIESGQVKNWGDFDSNPAVDYKWRCSNGGTGAAPWGQWGNANAGPLPHHKDSQGTSCRTFPNTRWVARGFQVRNVNW